MAATPLVSIIIPCCNGVARLRACLVSCLQQTYPRLEVLVVNNNSTDGSVELAQQLATTAPHPIRIFHCPQQGANHARNYGFTQAQGDYIQWLDADDELEPNKIALQVEALATHLNYDLACGEWQWCFYDSQGCPTCQFIFIPTPFRDYLLQRLVDNWQPPHAYLLRREAAVQLHKRQAWYPTTQVCMDREYFTLAALLGYRCLSVPGARVRYHSWSSAQITQATPYRKRVASLRRVFQRLQQQAQIQHQPHLQRRHWSLLQQSWDLWQPAATVIQQDENTFWLQHHQTQIVKPAGYVEAMIVGALQKSPEPCTLEDLARKVVRRLGLAICQCRESSWASNLRASEAMLSRDLSNLLGIPIHPETESLSHSLDFDAVPTGMSLSALLKVMPLYAPLFGNHRLVVHQILERLCQQGWLQVAT